MHAHRRARCERLIHRAVAVLLSQHAPEAAGLPTVTAVQLSPSGQEAQLYVSMMGNAEASEQTFEALQAAWPELQHRLMQQLGKQLGRLPRVRLIHDASGVQADKIHTLLQQDRKAHGH